MIRNLITSVRSFIAEFRYALFRVRIEREIYGKIFPHLDQEPRSPSSAYPFQSKEQLSTRGIHDALDAKRCLALFEQQAAGMGMAYSQAFRHIMYRDINRRLRRYLKIVQSRVPAEKRIRKFA